MKSITSASVILTLSVPGLFDTPQQIQEFAVDNVWDVDGIDNAEIMMGVDGVMSAGFVYVVIKQNIMLMASSGSNDFFETLYQTEQQAVDKLPINGTATMRSLNRSYAMNGGVMSNYKPMADAKKVMEPRQFTITWNSITPLPLGL